MSTEGDFDGLRITPIDPADLPDESSSLVSILVVGDDPIGFWWFEFTKVNHVFAENGYPLGPATAGTPSEETDAK